MSLSTKKVVVGRYTLDVPDEVHDALKILRNLCREDTRNDSFCVDCPLSLGSTNAKDCFFNSFAPEDMEFPDEV